MKPVALTIAGSDPSGGAGIQADLKTFHQYGVYGMSVITLLTAQNTKKVDWVEPLAPEWTLGQLDAILQDIPPQAAKTGALGNSGIIEAVSRRAASFDFPLVVDPVMISKHGTPLLQGDAVKALIKNLLPHAFLVMPNIHEAVVLSGVEVRDEKSLQNAALNISRLGPKAVLIKGGHLEGDATDLLYYEEQFHLLAHDRIDTVHTHGTGCTYSAAVTAELAKGTGLMAAVENAKQFISEAILTNPHLGQGQGPVNHHAEVPRKVNHDKQN